MSLNTCISYLNKNFQHFPHLLETCWVDFIFKYESAISYLFLENICSQSPLNFENLLSQKVTVKESASHFPHLLKINPKDWNIIFFQPCTKMFKILLHQRTFFYHYNNLLVQIPHLFSDINTWIEFFHMLRMALRLINNNKKNKGFLNLYHVRVSTLSVC